MSSSNHHDESIRRMSQAQALMDANNLDALLLFTGPNMAYFTGSGLFGGRSGSRPYVFVLPRQGQPALVVHDGRQYESRKLGGIDDVLTYSSLSCLPLEQVLHALASRGVQGRRIGLELGMEMVLDLPHAEFQRLRDALPQAEFIDASPLLWKCRMLKTEAEINCVRRACEITSEAYGRTFAEIRPGMAEQEIELKMLYHMMALGGKTPWVLITSGEGNYDLVSKTGTDRAVQPGEMVWMDGGCSVGGYYSDFSRAGVLGGPSMLQIEAQQEVHEVTRMGVDMLRPGMPVAEVAARCNEAVNALRLPVTSNISGLAGRVGHGLGMVVTELPSLSETDTTRLETGMIVTVEPGVVTPYGTFHIEENVVITDDGPQVLSSPYWQLWAI